MEFKLYRLFSDSTDKYYIGVTRTSLPQRKAVHKYHFMHPERFYSSTEVFRNSDFIDDVHIELLEGCYTKDEAHFIEKNLIRSCSHDRNMVNVQGRRPIQI